jgi:hypothetical protein
MATFPSFSTKLLASMSKIMVGMISEAPTPTPMALTILTA